MVVIAVIYAVVMAKEQIKRNKAEEERQEKWNESLRLTTPGETLYCVGCETPFPGPLTEEGCPKCHMTGLTMSAKKYNEENKNRVITLKGR